MKPEELLSKENTYYLDMGNYEEKTDVIGLVKYWYDNAKGSEIISWIADGVRAGVIRIDRNAD